MPQILGKGNMKNSTALKHKSEIVFYVSTLGNDRWSGRLAQPTADAKDGPLASIAGARDAIRALKKKEHGRLKQPVTVRIESGTYTLRETLQFTPQDSGTAEAPITYTAACGQTPIISGGRRITGWKVQTLRGQTCWVVDLPEVAKKRWNFTQLFVNGERRSRTRLPKQEHYRFTGIPAAKGGTWCQGPRAAHFAPGHIKAWKNLDDVELITYQLWFDTHHRIKKLDDKKHLVTFKAKSLGSLKDEKNLFARYCLENIFEVLDTPGQWYLDRRAGKLFYMPLPDETPETTEVIAPALDYLVRFEGTLAREKVQHIRLENLNFRHAEWVLPPNHPGSIQAAYHIPGAILFDGAENCVLYGCEISRLSQYAVELLAGSSENKIIACTMSDLGAGGVKINHEALDRVDETMTRKFAKTKNATVKPQRATVSDCTIHHGGLIYPSAIGIWIGNAGQNRILHNHIFDLNYTGISCGWSWGYDATRTFDNRIEYNHIHHINTNGLISDNGGIYTLGIQPGSTIRGNVIHDVSCYSYGGWGIYPDEGSSGFVIENNLVYRTKGPGFFTHYGRDNVVRNNIFALAENEHVIPVSRLEKHRATIFERNIVYWNQGSLWAGNWDPCYSLFRNNLFFDASGQAMTFTPKTIENWQGKGQHAQSLIADPLFQDPQAADFTLRADSPALKLGFKPFEASKAGPRFQGCRPGSFSDFSFRDNEPRELVKTLLQILNPVINNKNRPGRIKLTLTNLGPLPAAGKVSLQCSPTSAKITGPRSIRFALKPQTRKEVLFTVQVPPGTERFTLETQPQGKGLVPAFVIETAPKMIQGRVPRLPKIHRVDQVAQALHELETRSIAFTDLLPGKISFALAGTDLAVLARVHDPHVIPNEVPWKGSCLEIFGAMAEGAKIGQIFLQPATATQCAKAQRQLNGQPTPDPAIRLKTDCTPEGYLLQALIPLKSLALKNGLKKFLIEFKLTVTPNPKQNPFCGYLFESPAPSNSTTGYGVITIG
jgi:parallel beta-helix repeat protein